MSDIVLQVENLHTSFFTRAGEFKAVGGISFYCWMTSIATLRL